MESCIVTDQVTGRGSVWKERDDESRDFNDRGQPFTFAWKVTVPVGSCRPIGQKQQYRETAPQILLVHRVMARSPA